MELKNVTIGSFSKIEATGIVESGKTLYRLYRNQKYEQQKICIVDNDIAIDVNNFDNKYPIIKKDAYGRIIDEDILSSVKYAIDQENVSESVKRKYKHKVKQYKNLNR